MLGQFVPVDNSFTQSLFPTPRAEAGKWNSENNFSGFLKCGVSMMFVYFKLGYLNQISRDHFFSFRQDHQCSIPSQASCCNHCSGGKS